MAEVDSGPEPIQGSGSIQSTSECIVTLDGFDRNERVRVQTLVWRAGLVYAPRISKKTTHIIAADPQNVTPSKASLAAKYGIKIVSENFIADRIVKSVESPRKSTGTEPRVSASVDISRSISPTLGHLADSSDDMYPFAMKPIPPAFQPYESSRGPAGSNISFGAPSSVDNRAQMPKFGVPSNVTQYPSMTMGMQFQDPPLSLPPQGFPHMYSTHQPHQFYGAPLPSPTGYSQYPPAPMLHQSQMSPIPSPSAPPYHYYMPYSQYAGSYPDPAASMHAMHPGYTHMFNAPHHPSYGYPAPPVQAPMHQMPPYPYHRPGYSPESSHFLNNSFTSLPYVADYAQHAPRHPVHQYMSPSENRSPSTSSSSLSRSAISSSPRSVSSISSQPPYDSMRGRNEYYSRSPAQAPYPAIPPQMMPSHPLSIQVPPPYYGHAPRSAQQSPTAPPVFPSFSPSSVGLMPHSIMRPSPQPSPLAPPPPNPFGRSLFRQSQELLLHQQPPSMMMPPMPLDAHPDSHEYLPRESPPRFITIPNDSNSRMQQQSQDEAARNQARLARFLEYARERRTEKLIATSAEDKVSALSNLQRVAIQSRGRTSSSGGSTDDYTSDDEAGDSPSVDETIDSSDSDSDLSGTGTVQIHHSESHASSSVGDFSERLTLSPSSVDSQPRRKSASSSLTASEKRRAKFFRSNPPHKTIPEESESNVDSSDDPQSSPNSSSRKQSRKASISSDPRPSTLYQQQQTFAGVPAPSSSSSSSNVFAFPPRQSRSDPGTQQQQQPIMFFNPDSVSPIGNLIPQLSSLSLAPMEASRPPASQAEESEYEGLPSATTLTSSVKLIPGAPNVLSGIDAYEKMEKLGEGTYSIVYKVQDKRSGHIYAVKKTKEYGDGVSVTTVREVSVLRDCSDTRNIVRLHEVCMAPHLDCIFMVLEYIPFDMGCVLNSIRGRPLPLSHTKTLFKQLLHGIAELHERGYMHRDIKMTNLLLSREGVLKIADLGLARSIRTNDRWNEPDEAKLNSTALEAARKSESERSKAPRDVPKAVVHRYTSTVVTLWYRAPEVLLGAGRYDEKLDIWSCGCILAEWLLVKPLLPGKSEIDQLERTVRLLGHPNENTMPNLENLVQKTLLSTLPKDTTPSTFPPSTDVWNANFGNLDAATKDLLSILLNYDPLRRPSAREALLHPFFTTNPLPADPKEVADEIAAVYKPRKYDK